MTLDGYRVISLGYKKVSEKDFEDDNLIFCGFLYFENPLKEDTRAVIDNLMYAKLNLKVVSGDNALTTI